MSVVTRGCNRCNRVTAILARDSHARVEQLISQSKTTCLARTREKNRGYGGYAVTQIRFRRSVAVTRNRLTVTQEVT